ncbi:MAG: hypothetical protein QOJ05_687, partial [Verrucomicrobiota bacterium]
MLSRRAVSRPPLLDASHDCNGQLRRYTDAPLQGRGVRTEGALLGSKMRHFISAVVLALAASAFAQTPPLEERVAKQNALFEEFYETGLKNSPERATSFGDYRYNSELGQYSLAEIARQHAEADDFLKRLKEIPTDGMSDKDLLSHQLLQ